MKINCIYAPLVVLAGAVVLVALCAGAIKLCGSDSAGEPRPHSLRLPKPPAMMLNEQEQQAYVARHYWDNFDFEDVTWGDDTTALGQTFATYAWMLSVLNPSEAAGELKRFFVRAEVSPLLSSRFYELAEMYLADPNSPYRNEELFIPVLESQVASAVVDSLMKIRPRMLLDMALRNRPGSKAADFSYTQASGAQGRLWKLGGKFTLVYFYNPDCPDCERVRNYIISSPVFGPLVKDRSLTVLALYTDQNLDLWRSRLSVMPREWTAGYSLTLLSDGLYDLKAIPTLYLLDENKKVVLKDVQVEFAEAVLAELNGAAASTE